MVFGLENKPTVDFATILYIQCNVNKLPDMRPIHVWRMTNACQYSMIVLFLLKSQYPWVLGKGLKGSSHEPGMSCRKKALTLIVQYDAWIFYCIACFIADRYISKFTFVIINSVRNKFKKQL
jgi:hypothetical protein